MTGLGGKIIIKRFKLSEISANHEVSLTIPNRGRTTQSHIIKSSSTVVHNDELILTIVLD